MRICKVAHVGKEHWKMGFCVTERDTHEDAFPALPATRAALVFREVKVSNCGVAWIVCKDVAETSGREEVFPERGKDEEEEDGGEGCHGNETAYYAAAPSYRA